MKKQTVLALVMLLLMPIVLMLGGLGFRLINPESAAGHPNYVRNYHLLSMLQHTMFLAAAGAVVVLWFLLCYLVIRSKEQSASWLCVAVLGPLGFAILSMLNDKAPLETDRYARFVRHMNKFVRVGYEACVFVGIWMLAYQGMVVKRNLMIMVQSATTGMSKAQILDIQNASSGMWAFAEGNEVMYLVVLFYLLLPIVFNIVGRGVASMAPSKAR